MQDVAHVNELAPAAAVDSHSAVAPSPPSRHRSVAALPVANAPASPLAGLFQPWQRSLLHWAAAVFEHTAVRDYILSSSCSDFLFSSSIPEWIDSLTSELRDIGARFTNSESSAAAAAAKNSLPKACAELLCRVSRHRFHAALVELLTTRSDAAMHVLECTRRALSSMFGEHIAAVAAALCHLPNVSSTAASAATEFGWVWLSLIVESLAFVFDVSLSSNDASEALGGSVRNLKQFQTNVAQFLFDQPLMERVLQIFDSLPNDVSWPALARACLADPHIAQWLRSKYEVLTAVDSTIHRAHSTTPLHWFLGCAAQVAALVRRAINVTLSRVHAVLQQWPSADPCHVQLREVAEQLARVNTTCMQAEAVLVSALLVAEQLSPPLLQLMHVACSPDVVSSVFDLLCAILQIPARADSAEICVALVALVSRLVSLPDCESLLADVRVSADALSLFCDLKFTNDLFAVGKDGVIDWRGFATRLSRCFVAGPNALSSRLGPCVVQVFGDTELVLLAARLSLTLSSRAPLAQRPPSVLRLHPVIRQYFEFDYRSGFRAPNSDIDWKQFRLRQQHHVPSLSSQPDRNDCATLDIFSGAGLSSLILAFDGFHASMRAAVTEIGGFRRGEFFRELLDAVSQITRAPSHVNMVAPVISLVRRAAHNGDAAILIQHLHALSYPAASILCSMLVVDRRNGLTLPLVAAQGSALAQEQLRHSQQCESIVPKLRAMWDQIGASLSVPAAERAQWQPPANVPRAGVPSAPTPQCEATRNDQWREDLQKLFNATRKLGSDFTRNYGLCVASASFALCISHATSNDLSVDELVYLLTQTVLTRLQLPRIILADAALWDALADPAIGAALSKLALHGSNQQGKVATKVMTVPKLLLDMQDLFRLPAFQAAMRSLRSAGTALALANAAKLALELLQSPAVQVFLINLVGALGYQRLANLTKSSAFQRLVVREDFWGILFDETTITSIASGSYMRLVLSRPVMASVRKTWQDASRQRVQKLQQTLGRLRPAWMPAIGAGTGSGGAAETASIDPATDGALGIQDFFRTIMSVVGALRGLRLSDRAAPDNESPPRLVSRL
jgi:hypothetical protein